MMRPKTLDKWFTPGIGVKRWVILLLFGIIAISLSVTVALLELLGVSVASHMSPLLRWFEIGLGAGVGLALVCVSLIRFSQNLLAPYRKHQQSPVIDLVYSHSRRNKGLRVVAIGGGTGLPAVLKGLKAFTSNITAVVTVADDGGSSGRLRRDLGVLPPGDLRNNIAALADDESLMTQLFQYRFQNGDLGGHAFGNLFITALAGVTGSLETALIETERVLNIQGSVLPATLSDVTLTALIHPRDSGRATLVRGESRITAANGRIERLQLDPPDVPAYHGAVRAILEANFLLIGPGSLYTSIIPNLLVPGIADALRATSAYKVYVCNIAMQPGETDDFTVAEHILALERHIGRGVFQAVIANNHYPIEKPGGNTRYVQPAAEHHEVLQRYDVRYFDLVDPDRPWRHEPNKLVRAILWMSEAERSTAVSLRAALTQISG